MIENESFLSRDIILMIIGALIGWGLSWVTHFSQTSKLTRDRIKQEKKAFLQERTRVRTLQDSPNRAIYDLNKLLGINDIYYENIFFPLETLRGERSPLSREWITGELRSQAVEYPEIITDQMFYEFIGYAKDEALRNGQTFDNNGSFSLKKIRVDRPEGDSGSRERSFHLYFEPTDYEHFVFPNKYLVNKTLHPVTGEELTVRELTGLKEGLLRIEKFDSLPFHFMVGVNTLLITCDNYLVLSVRSRQQLIAGDIGDGTIAVHMSTAEGMFRSTNNDGKKSDEIDGAPNPFATSDRAFIDELGLIPHQDFDPSKTECLGYFTDQQRAQPVFIMRHISENLTADDVINRWEARPKDGHENTALLFAPWSADVIMQMYMTPSVNFMFENHFHFGQADRRLMKELATDHRIRLASNHAKAGILMGLLSAHRLDHVAALARIHSGSSES